jgi:hypothetical protein
MPRSATSGYGFFSSLGVDEVSTVKFEEELKNTYMIQTLTTTLEFFISNKKNFIKLRKNLRKL